MKRMATVTWTVFSEVLTHSFLILHIAAQAMVVGYAFYSFFK